MNKSKIPFIIAIAAICGGAALALILLLVNPGAGAKAVASESAPADYQIDTVVGSAAVGVRTATSEDGSVQPLPESESVHEPIVDEEPEPEPETETEPVVEEEPAEEVQHFYKITTTNRVTILRLREQPNLEAKILYKMPPGTPGYVIHRGDLWSYIVASTKDGLQTGYAFNGYLWFEEMDEADIPEEVRAVPVPDPWPEEGEGPSDFVGNPHGNDVGGTSGPSSPEDASSETEEASADTGDSGSGSGSDSDSGSGSSSGSSGSVANKGSEYETATALDDETKKTLADYQKMNHTYGDNAEIATALSVIQQDETRDESNGGQSPTSKEGKAALAAGTYNPDADDTTSSGSSSTSSTTTDTDDSYKNRGDE